MEKEALLCEDQGIMGELVFIVVEREQKRHGNG
jgi:hypothetical protein